MDRKKQALSLINFFDITNPEKALPNLERSKHQKHRTQAVAEDPCLGWRQEHVKGSLQIGKVLKRAQGGHKKLQLHRN